MDNKEFEKLIKQDDAFDTRKLLEGVDLSDVTEEIDLEEILAEFGHHQPPPPPAEDDTWINEGYVPKPVHPREEKKKEAPAPAAEKPPDSSPSAVRR